MPFANLASPSIALTQLKSVTEARFPGRVSVDIVYLTHDFGMYLGKSQYDYVANSMQALYAGFGDWFFRAVAFPELPDNTETYLRRFYSRKADLDKIKELVLDKRPKLDQYLDSLIERYALHEANIVGFTSMFMQNAASFVMARKLKQRNPDLITVLGGANCESPMGKVIAQHVGEVDFVFSGPALKSFPNFVQRYLDGQVSGRAVSQGIDEKWISPSASEAELDIDVPIKLDYDDFLQGFHAYFPDARTKPTLPIETSRGCWWGQRAHCTFCGLNGATMAYRAMKPELAIEQFKSLFRYSGEVGAIESVDNILPKNYIEQVLPFLDTPKDMELFYEVKADLTKEDMAVLAKARVKSIQPGIESLATSTLKLMKKGTSANQNISFLKNCLTFSIKPQWNLLIGFPGEGAAVYQRYTEFLPLLTHLPPPNGVYPVRFDRYSPYHTHADTYGLDLDPMDFYSLVYPFNKTDLQDFAYYFTDRNWRAEYIQSAAQWVMKLQALVDQWRAKWVVGQDHMPPKLHFNEAGEVYDSRSGSVTHHRVGALGEAMLNRATEPVRVEELMREFSDHGSEATRTLELLEKEGLLFREGERVVSLVMSPALQASEVEFTAVSAS